MDSRRTKYAVLKTADGNTVMLAAGEEKNGVKLLRIEINRVAVEHLGKEIELSLFSGLRSRPPLPPKKD